MDTELRTALEALSAKIDAVDAKLGVTRAVAETALAIAMQARDEAKAAHDEARAAHDEAKAARREAGVMFETILREIRALPEGLSSHQREEADRLDSAREQTMLDAHVAPMERGVADHERRIARLERNL